MTVHLAMRSKCTCNSSCSSSSNQINTSSSNASQLFKTSISNYINSGNNLSSNHQRNVTIVLLDSKYMDFSYDVSPSLLDCSSILIAFNYRTKQQFMSYSKNYARNCN